MTSTILKEVMSIPRFILWPIEMLLTLLLWLLMRVTLGRLALIYTPIYNACWLPISLYVRGTGFVYRELFTPRPLLALITVPLLFVFDIIRVLLPNTDKEDKRKKAQLLESWPYSPDIIANVPKIRGQSLEGNHCPQCLKPVASDWEVCQYCGEKLEECPHCFKFISASFTQCTHCGKAIQEKVGMIRQCHMCGDMLNPGWKRCARCGEPVEDESQPILGAI